MSKKFKTGISADGNIYAPEVHAAAKLVADTVGGDEGGEIYLGPALTNTTLSGGVTIDVYQNKLRFFEQGGSARGYYIDMTGGGAGVSTNLVGSGTGSVTSVGLSLPAIFTVTNSPVTSSGTLTGTLASQSANIVFAGPSTGPAAAPTFRSLVAADIPTLNQNTTGSAATLTTPRAIYGNNFNGSADLTQIIASTYGGTGNGFTKFTGPATTEKTFTLPNSSATILTSAAAVTVAQGGTGTGTAGITAFNNITGYTSSGATGTTSTNLVFSTSPTITTPTIDTINASASSTAALLWNTVITTGSISIGGALTTGIVNIATGTSFTSATGGQSVVNIGTGAHTATTRTINIGGAGVGGTIALNLGSTTGTSTIALNGTVTNTGNLNVTGKADIVYDSDLLTGTSGVIYAGNTAPASPAVGDIWVSSASSALSNILRWRKIATAGQTTLTGLDDSSTTLLYTPGYEQVYINGVLIYRGTDYTATNGTTITISSGLTASDTIEVIAPSMMTSGDYYTQSQSDSRYYTQTQSDALYYTQSQADSRYPIFATDQISGFRNIIINGGFAIDQRNSGATQTFVAAAALAYSVDRWYGYSTGANITGARVTGTAPDQYYYRFTGATSNTAVGFGQRIEAANSQHLAGTTATLSVKLASSSLTSITWTAYYANSTDTFGTLASPTRTQIATGTFTINSTLTRYSTNISIPSAATTGIEIVFTGGALLATQTLTFAAAQLEAGSRASVFEQRTRSIELALCQRYYYKAVAAGAMSFGNGHLQNATTAQINFITPVTLRSATSGVAPTITSSAVANFIAIGINGTTNAPTSIGSAYTASMPGYHGLSIGLSASTGAGPTGLYTTTANTFIAIDAEM